MQFRLVVTFVLAGATFGSSSANGQDREPLNHGQWWGRQPSSVRNAFVSGYNEGVLDGIGFAWLISGRANSPTVVDAARLGLTAEQRQLLQEMHDKYSANRIPTDVGVDAVVDNISHLYSDPANSLIPVPYVIRIAIMRVRGADAQLVDRELALAREFAATRR